MVRQSRAMAGDDTNKAQATRLKAARVHADLKNATAGWQHVRQVTRSQVSKDAYLQHENGTRSLKGQAQDYADAFKVPAGWLVWGDDAPEWATLGADDAGTDIDDVPLFDLDDVLKLVVAKVERKPETAGRLKPVNRRIPIVGEVAAGLWRETYAVEIEQVTDWLPMEVAGYERAALYALKVVGSSMNSVYPPGRYVIVAPAHEAGVRWGDYVIVERHKADLVEVTIKELVSDRGRVALWPRSYDPAFQEPIYIRGDLHDQTAPRIIGVVVGDYGRRERPPQGAGHP